jgi:hypothetical protein
MTERGDGIAGGEWIADLGNLSVLDRLRRFVPAPVAEAVLSNRMDEILAPRQQDITVVGMIPGDAERQHAKIVSGRKYLAEVRSCQRSGSLISRSLCSIQTPMWARSLRRSSATPRAPAGRAAVKGRRSRVTLGRGRA